MLKLFEKRKQKKREEQLRKLHSGPETTYTILHRTPMVGDTTVPYDLDQILELYSEADQYALQKIQSGIAVDEMSGNFLKNDIEIRVLMLRTLLFEWRERHRNARVSINEEKQAYKLQLEKELEDLQKKYNELSKGDQL